MFMNSFLKPGLEKEFTLLDCCLGRPDCLNLKHVVWKIKIGSERLKRRLFIRTKHMHILGVMPFIKLQNDT